MNKDDFERKMALVDEHFARQGMPANVRALLAIREFDPKYELVFPAPQPVYGQDKYQGSNLFRAIGEWYEAHYPNQTVLKPFGERPFIIRGEVFFATMPLIFNPVGQIDARRHIQGLTDNLWNLLTEKQRDQLQKEFNREFNEVSSLALLTVSIKSAKHNNKQLVYDLLIRGYGDLQALSKAFRSDDPHASVWTAQQAVEKYLKLFIAFIDKATTEVSLRKQFGHKINSLAKKAAELDRNFEQIKDNAELLSIAPEERYKVRKMPPAEAVHLINAAFAICHLVTCVILMHLKSPFEMQSA